MNATLYLQKQRQNKLEICLVASTTVMSVCELNTCMFKNKYFYFTKIFYVKYSLSSSRLYMVFNTLLYVI